MDYKYLVFFVQLSVLGMLCEAGFFNNGPKKVIIHLPMKVKQHTHTHTVYKHIHHKEPEVESKVIAPESGEPAKHPEVEHQFLGYTHEEVKLPEPVKEEHSVEGGEKAAASTTEWKPSAAPMKLYTSAVGSAEKWMAKPEQLYTVDHGQAKEYPSFDYGTMLKSGGGGWSSDNGGHELMGYTYGGQFDAHIPKPSYNAWLTTTYKSVKPMFAHMPAHFMASYGPMPKYVYAAPEVSHQAAEAPSYGPMPKYVYAAPEVSHQAEEAPKLDWPELHQQSEPQQPEPQHEQHQQQHEPEQNQQQQHEPEQHQPNTEYKIQVQHPESHQQPQYHTGDAQATSYQNQEDHGSNSWAIGNNKLEIPHQSHGNEVQMKNFAAVQSILKEAGQQWTPTEKNSGYEQVQSVGIQLPSHGYGGEDAYPHISKRSSVAESADDVAATARR